MRRFFWLIGLLLLALMPGAMVLAQTNQGDAAAQKAVGYIRTQQAADGTFAGFGAGSTADAVIAIAAAGINAGEVKKGAASATDGLAKLAPDAAKDTGVAAKFVIAALLAGQNPRTLGGDDLVAVVEKGFNPATGQYGKDVTGHALSLLALRAAGSTPQTAAVSQLAKLQLPDGGWSFDGTAGTGSDTNTTALAYQALVASRVSASNTAPAEQKAVNYLKSQQNADGGFPYSQTSKFGNASDANSTALAYQMILASGDKPESWAKNGKTPLDRLLAFQNPSGAFRFQDAPPDDNQLATYQAIPPIKGKTYPLAGILITEPASSNPARLPNTGVSSPALVPVLALAVLLIAAGLLLRRTRV